VIDLCPGPCFSRPEILGRVGGKLLFSASATSPHGGFRLWATDGIEVHAIGVDELRPWYASPDAIDGWLYFSLGNSVWRSDGADLEPALDIPDPSSSRVVIQLFGIGSRAFARRLGSLSAPDDLWEILPTSREVLRGCTPSDWISEVAVLGDAAYFGARCVDGLSDLGPGLFRTDGSPGGTVRIRTFENGPPSFLLPTAREIFFLEGAMGSNGTPIYRIWRTDGTAAGTVRLTGFFPWLRMQLALGDRYLLFSTINQLHALDLTTGAIADLPIPPSGLVTADPSGSFALVGGRNGWWVTYGTPAQTFQVFTANPQAPSPLSAAVFLGVRAVFSGEHGVDGEDLWVMGLPTALDIPVLGWPGVLLLALLLAAAALRSLSRRHPVATRSG
jgi:hypothetical protein